MKGIGYESAFRFLLSSLTGLKLLATLTQPRLPSRCSLFCFLTHRVNASRVPICEHSAPSLHERSLTVTDSIGSLVGLEVKEETSSFVSH